LAGLVAVVVAGLELGGGVELEAVGLEAGLVPGLEVELSLEKRVGLLVGL
jgi:hypothetical protein